MSLLKSALFSSFVLGISSCAHNPQVETKSPASQANQQETVEASEAMVEKTKSRIQTHLVDENLPVCHDCIIGSIGDEQLKASSKKIYFLYGAEHLGLENYYFDIPVVYNKATKKWINYFFKIIMCFFNHYLTNFW